VCAGIVASGCGLGTPPPGTTRIVDDAGDTVLVHLPAGRVVSLIPASTELLFAIGAGPSVVGRTAWCDFPAAVVEVPNLGDGINPNLEAILGAHPDLVLLYNSAQNAVAASRLEAVGIPALRLNLDALGDVARIARLLGRVTGHTREADSVVAVYDTALAAATVVGSSRRPKVLLLVWDQPLMTIGTGSFLSELVERAGGANLFGDLQSSSAVVSLEAVSTRDPDVILVPSDGSPSFPQRPEWRAVRAVRTRRVLTLHGSQFSRPTPRAPAAIRELAQRLGGGLR